ncbi:hypothetical protein [Falsiroseomonas sp.]|uniref:hypothetical protein n=1 Tax=Falsiroseomonas sp. TaxID=2870721 RepID=UPI003F6FC77E
MTTHARLLILLSGLIIASITNASAQPTVDIRDWVQAGSREAAMEIYHPRNWIRVDHTALGLQISIARDISESGALACNAWVQPHPNTQGMTQAQVDRIFSAQPSLEDADKALREMGMAGIRATHVTLERISGRPAPMIQASGSIQRGATTYQVKMAMAGIYLPDRVHTTQCMAIGTTHEEAERLYRAWGRTLGTIIGSTIVSAAPLR